MRQIKYQQALREGYASGMRSDSSTFIVGEGIGRRGGCFVETVGLYDEFGPERVLDMPISESGFVGMCAGAAACGTRAIANLMFVDFMAVAMDQIVNQAAKMSHVSNGQFKMPLTLTGMYGIGGSQGAHHSNAFYPWFINSPGIKVLMPSTSYDVKGLLTAAILDDNLTILLHHRGLIHLKGDVPEEDYTIPIGKAEVVREGSDVTVVAIGIMRHRSLEAAKLLESKGVSVEVIDPRTLMPLDKETITESVVKTGRLVVADEGYSPCGFGSEVITMVQEEVFDSLDAPMVRVQTMSVPIPYSPPLEKAVMPGVEHIVKAIEKVCEFVF